MEAVTDAKQVSFYTGSSCGQSGHRQSTPSVYADHAALSGVESKKVALYSTVVDCRQSEELKTAERERGEGGGGETRERDRRRDRDRVRERQRQRLPASQPASQKQRDRRRRRHRERQTERQTETESVETERRQRYNDSSQQTQKIIKSNPMT